MPVISQVDINSDFSPKSVFYICRHVMIINKIASILKNTLSVSHEFSHLRDFYYFSRKIIFWGIKAYQL